MRWETYIEKPKGAEHLKKTYKHYKKKRDNNFTHTHIIQKTSTMVQHMRFVFSAIYKIILFVEHKMRIWVHQKILFIYRYSNCSVSFLFKPLFKINCHLAQPG